MTRYLPFGWAGWGRQRDPENQLLDSTHNNAPTSSALPVSQPASSEANHTTARMELSAPAPAAGARHSNTIDANNILRGLERVGLGLKDVALLYWKDTYHTMLTLKWGRFLAIFFCIYVVEYMCFAILYLTVRRDCITGAHTFALALWFSVRTATTIGYSEQLQPNVTCTSINLLVTFQVISAALVDYCMMGLVFARFATPMARAASVKFSNTAALHQLESGFWALSFRLANVRKHCLLRPETSIFLVSPDSHGTTSLQFEEMHIAEHKSHMANLRLGVPTLITHVITPDSPLFDLSIDGMQQRGLELLIFLDAIDPMTSNNIAARWSYAPHDLRMNRRFSTLDQRDRRGKTLLNFGEFDSTVPAVMHPVSHLDSEALALRTLRSLTPLPASSGGSGGGFGGAFTSHGMPPSGNTDWQVPSPSPSLQLADREHQLAALCDAVMRDANASPELRHMAHTATFHTSGGGGSGGAPRSRTQQQQPQQQQQQQQPQSYSLPQTYSLPQSQQSQQPQQQQQQHSPAGSCVSSPPRPTSILDLPSNGGPGDDTVGGGGGGRSSGEGPRWRSAGGGML